MDKEYLIGDFLKRIKRPIELEPNQDYNLVTIKMNHKGVVLRGSKNGSDIKSKMFQVKEGDFILSGIDARNGAFGIVPKELEGAIVTNDFWYFEIDENIILKQLFLELTTMSWFDEICRKGSDGTTQRIRLQKSKFFNQKILLPDANDQKELLDKILSFKKGQYSLNLEIESQKNNIIHLRQAILQDAVQGKLTEDWRTKNSDTENASINLERIKVEKRLQIVKEREIPFKLNPSWKWSKFIDVAELRHGHQFRNYDFVEEGIPVIKIGQCKPDGTLDFSKCNYIESSRKNEFENDLIFKGHLLMALTGGTLGKVTRVDKDYGILVQNYRVGNFFADERVITLDFLNVILESELFQSLVREKINQNAQPNIGKDSIEKIVMPIPPLEEQKAIVEKVNALMGLCDALEQEVQQSQEHSEMMMQSVLREVFEPNNLK